jgi:hypothetical protein
MQRHFQSGCISDRALPVLLTCLDKSSGLIVPLFSCLLLSQMDEAQAEVALLDIWLTRIAQKAQQI